MRRRSARMPRTSGLPNDPEWYKDAIIYELRVRSFFDSDGDGGGDFRGLASKLDYLSDLGVNALWLLPFYPSPMRDDGYDISEYTAVHPNVGTLEDFRYFLEEAHARGLRVITELVLNHTSDQHPWFQRARRAPRGSKERDFYVWSPDTEPYQEARIIFKDFETSNWTRDPVAGDYFWHRFYSHQPDLNFENLAVHDALLDVVDFWLKMGVDGLRLDAVPYLYEEDETNCENLPKTHAFLKKLREHVDRNFSNRMLLAEANQWPEDAAAYFGAGDECHMNFHFPIMPRMFMAIHMEDSFPIVDILAQTPTPPASCQWALFLRNHDELTLEMVTDDERDYMYRAYATDSAARINLGIRRRLAPLVGNDRRKIELLNGLLFSLSGTPVLYYGDEIGMGDNVFLGDRNGVRTPMQWSMDRNAGFSKANNQRLILPVNVDSEYHYESLNVEAQQNNPSSLLWWTKRLIAVRGEYQAFGRGNLEILTLSNSRVIAFTREFESETILVVANLSRSVQFVELDLAPHKGKKPVELFGGATFPAIGDAPYPVTLSAHSFYWFSLERALGEQVASSPHPDDVLILTSSKVESFFEENRRTIEDALPAFLETRSWFRGRGREVDDARIVDVVPWGAPEQALTWLVARVAYAEGEPETYSLLVMFVPDATAREGRFASSTPLVRAKLGAGADLHGDAKGDSSGVFVDALEDGLAARTLLDGIAQHQQYRGQASVIRGSSFESIQTSDLKVAPHGLTGRHASSLVQFDDRYLLKVPRYIEDATSVDLEVALALSERNFVASPRVLGAIEFAQPRQEPVTLAVLFGYVANAGTAWQRTLGELGRYYERVLTTYREGPAPPCPVGLPKRLDVSEAPPVVRDLMGNVLDLMTLLGRRTADLHKDLLAMTAPAFAAEPYSTLGRRSEYQSLRNLAGTVLRQLSEHRGRLTGRALADAELVLQHRAALLKRFDPLLTERGAAIRIRVHGNYHLEQILYTGKDFVIVDFGGEHDRSFSERRRKQSPLRDLGGMLRSVDSAALVALWEPGTVREADRAALAPWASLWSVWASGAFLWGYEESAAGTSLVPEKPEQVEVMLDAFVLERALRDLRDELEWHSEGTIIPLRALAHTLESVDVPSTESPLP